MKRIEDFTGGQIELSTGTVYAELRRLEENGLVRSTREQGGRRRRMYQTNIEGNKSLKDIGHRIRFRITTILRPLMKRIESGQAD